MAGPDAAVSSERDAPSTADRILDAAEALFAERGLAGTAVRDIAARTGLNAASLYNHFPGKEALYAAVLERGIRPMLDALAEFVEEGDPDLRGQKRIERMMESLAARPCLPRLIQYEVLTGGTRLSPLLREWIRPLLARAQQLVEGSEAARRWKAEEIPLLVLAIYHVVIGYFTVAPLYEDLNGEDLLLEQARARQTRFLQHFMEALFPERS
jgi:AcrR family transcriptional regulator